MVLSLKAKQVASVTLIVGAAALVLNLVHLSYLARLGLTESHSRGLLLTNAIFQQARNAVTSREHAPEELQHDPGIRSLLESAIGYSRNVTYAAIVDTRNVAMAHSSTTLEGRILEPESTLDGLMRRSLFAQLRAVYEDRTFEVQQPLLLGDEHFGAIRIGLSTILVRSDLEEALAPALVFALIALAASMFAAMLLSQLMLRPIHVLKSGLTRLQRGEFGVTLDLPPGDEFAELGSSFNTVSAELAEVRSKLAGQSARLESLVDRLEDAVAVVNPQGELVFCNSAMRGLLAERDGQRSIAALAADHPLRRAVEQALRLRATQGPFSAQIRPVDSVGPGAGSEVLITANVIQDAGDRFLGVMLVCRNLAYLSQVQSTMQYSRKLAALGRLLAGVAHEVKNPLNAMTIHLELLKQKLSGAPPRIRRGRGVAAAPVSEPPGPSTSPDVLPVDVPAAMSHVTIIADEIRRLDEVIQGFLKFSRPDELTLEAIDMRALIADVVQVIEPQALDVGVVVLQECADGLPCVRGDRGMLRQALLNLALNAIQAMTKGGTLRFGASAAGRELALEVSDTGQGIAPEHLERVFDLYFTTKEGGSGIGLSMVFRTVQLHDGHIEVQSTRGHGTTFRILLPQDRRRELRPGELEPLGAGVAAL